MKDGARWKQVSPSAFAHERAGLVHVREGLPDVPPYRAWANFEFIADGGQLSEVDLLVACPAGLVMLELKAWSGRLTGGQRQWVQRGDRDVPRENPLFLTNLKAKRLRGLLEAEARKAGGKGTAKARRLPFIQAAVFLHAPDVKVELDATARQHLYGLDGHATGLPGVLEGLLMAQPSDGKVLSEQESKALEVLLDRLGLKALPTTRRIGAYSYDGKATDEGPGWQDFRGEHVSLKDPVRIRQWLPERAQSPEERQAFRNAAEREYRLLRHLDHPGLERPREFEQTDRGPAVVFDHADGYVPLDAALAALGGSLPLTTALDVLTQVGEVLRYAHSRSTTHRALTPTTVRVHQPLADPPRVRVVDWQSGARAAYEGTGSALGGARSAVPATSHVDALLGDADGGYVAPEVLLRAADADGPAADAFALGALAHLLLTGHPPAENALALRERVLRDGGLDVASIAGGLPERLRHLVRWLTHPEVPERLVDLPMALEELLQARKELEQEEPEPHPVQDPLEADVGAMLDDRFLVERRLGAGSTAVGLLVVVAGDEGGTRDLVLKVARDEDKADRLRDEAEVLAQVDDRRVVRLVEPEPLVVGGRTALLLESAGERTLATRLHEVRRLPLDELVRYGRDLLDVLALLDAQGVDHRDVKPDNLGIRPDPGSRRPHLVLFDFSLSRSPGAALTGGTPPYLDPFLGTPPGLPRRPSWDSAAERYSAAATLLHMASGRTPTYGDGRSDPAAVDAPPALDADLFDPSVASGLLDFFAVALARSTADRHTSWEAMRNSWDAALAPADAEQPEAAQQAAEQASEDTPLGAAGLSARAVSAVEQLPEGVTTVGELLDVPGTRLRSLRGVRLATKDELTTRRREWLQRLRGGVPTTTDAGAAEPDDVEVQGVDALVSRLLERAGQADDEQRALVDALLGDDSPVDDPFQGVDPLAGLLTRSESRVRQALEQAREVWRRDRNVTRLADEVVAVLEQQSRVASVQEVAGAVLLLRGSTATGGRRRRRALGLLRVVVEAELARTPKPDGTGGPRLERSVRPNGRHLLALTSDERSTVDAESLVAAAAGLGARADALVERDLVLAPGEALAVLRERPWPGDAAPGDARLLRLATAASSSARVSARDEVYRDQLPRPDAVRLALQAVPARAELRPDDVRRRVAARFPDATPLPDDDEALAALVDRAEVAVRWDAQTGAFVVPGASTTGSTSRTSLTALPAELRRRRQDAEVDHRLRQSLSQRSFLALPVPPRDLDAVRRWLVEAYGVHVLDLTGALLDALRREAEQLASPIPWEKVLEADAAPPGSPGQRGLRQLVTRAWAQVREQVETADTPLLLVEPGPLARYGLLADVERWAETRGSRAHARWLLLPATGQHLVSVDGQPVPLPSAAAQVLALGPLQWKFAQRQVV